jgi:hypothetical protein
MLSPMADGGTYRAASRFSCEGQHSGGYMQAGTQCMPHNKRGSRSGLLRRSRTLASRRETSGGCA